MTGNKKPCRHCGECCLAVTCALGQAIFLIAETDVCPAIKTEDGLYYCGLINNTADYVSKLVGTDLWKCEFDARCFCRTYWHWYWMHER